MSPSQHPRPLYLNGPTEGVFALFHDAADRRSETAVLLCPPFGWDPICPHCELLRFGEHLAAGGYPTLQIDLPGSGNSAGNPGDPERLQAWTQAVIGGGAVAASGERRTAHRGCRRRAWRPGLPSEPHLEQAHIDDLVLWAVPARGRTLVRELRMASRASGFERLGSRRSGATAPARGSSAGGGLSAQRGNGYGARGPRLVPAAAG